MIPLVLETTSFWQCLMHSSVICYLYSRWGPLSSYSSLLSLSGADCVNFHSTVAIPCCCCDLSHRSLSQWWWIHLLINKCWFSIIAPFIWSGDYCHHWRHPNKWWLSIIAPFYLESWLLPLPPTILISNTVNPPSIEPLWRCSTK